MEKMSRTWKVELFVPILITGGFFVHLINFSRYLENGQARVGDVLKWPVDLCLASIMVFCAVALFARRKDFFEVYGISSTARQVGYWCITVYITMSIPGHLLFLSTGNTKYFDTFPWWFSLVIMPVYVLIIAYFVTLSPRADT